jgi:hypothetical protein
MHESTIGIRFLAARYVPAFATKVEPSWTQMRAID